MAKITVGLPKKKLWVVEKQSVRGPHMLTKTPTNAVIGLLIQARCTGYC